MKKKEEKGGSDSDERAQQANRKLVALDKPRGVRGHAPSEIFLKCFAQ